jgi:hypothetical protein
MKAKLKGKGGIKGFFLLHGEKIAILLFGGLALFFIWKSLSLPRLDDDYQADKLQSAVTATNTAVTQSRWPDADSPNLADVREFKPIAKSLGAPIKKEDYLIGQIRPPVIAPSILRTDPEVLSAIEVKAIGMSGVLAFQDEHTATERQRRQSLEMEEQRQKELEAQDAATAESFEGRGGRGRERDGESMFAGAIDPDHPTRRPLTVGNSSGAVQLQGGERLERAHWATVLAKVPIREQLKRYQDAFQNARGGFDPARDFPRYIGFIVERCEVQNGKDTAWTSVPLKDGQRGKPAIGSLVTDRFVAKLMQTAGTDYAMASMEPVDARYIDYVLTLPLPPMVGREFGPDATHPDIPLAIHATPEQMVEPEVETPVEAPAEGDDELQFGSADGTQPGAGFPTAPGMPMNQGYGPRMPMGEFGGERGGWGGGRSREMMPGGGPQSFASMGPTSNRTELPRGVDYWLLRFFDFTVEPGKKYKYRVQLILADPNAGIPSSMGMLDQTVLDRRTNEAKTSKNKKPLVYRKAAISDPSPAVGIPIDGDIRIAGAKQPSGKQAYEEPTVQLWAQRFEIDEVEDEALHVAKDQGGLLRGSVINVRGKMLYTDVNKQWRDTFDEHAIDTNMTVLDIEGADRIGKDMTSPARVMLMDAAGELAIRDEMDDSLAVLQLKNVFTEDKRRRPEDEGEMMGGPEGFRPPRGGGRRP